MNLVDAESAPTCVTFPDLSGELYQLMWEKREYERDFAELLSTGAGLLLFVHSDTIVAPQWIVDVVAQCKQIGIPVPEESKISWHPRLAPTQVQIVDLLQLMQASPLDMPSGKLAVMMSAWDKAAPEGRTPKEYLNERMPLLGQYLFGNWDESDCRIYGVSAFGGDPETKKAELLGLDKQSERIRLVHDTDESHDLTEPIAWLGI